MRSAGAQEPAAFWPTGIKGTVSLTFDGGKPSHLDFVVPILDRNGLQGTFFVNAAPTPQWLAQGAAWQEVAAMGHEIGNNSSASPCSCAHESSNPNFCLERLSVQQVWETVEASQTVLDVLFPEMPAERRTFAYPCYETFTGKGQTRLSYVPLVASEFLAARGGSHRISNEPWSVDLSYVQAWDVEGRTSEQIIEFIEEGVSKGRWVVLVFQGIGESPADLSETTFAEVVDFLDEHNGSVWTETFSRVSSFVGLRRHQRHSSGR
jgi:hypothetical protein